MLHMFQNCLDTLFGFGLVWGTEHVEFSFCVRLCFYRHLSALRVLALARVDDIPPVTCLYSEAQKCLHPLVDHSNGRGELFGLHGNKMFFSGNVCKA